jgi:hypothetical protein
MQLLDSQAVARNLESYARDRLVESDFFSALSTGQVQPEHVREVFGQYYVWRNRFHRWFGICVAKSAPFGDARNLPRVLDELITCLHQEIKGNHHELAFSFLTALGIADPTGIEALPVTESYAESFLRCYFSADRTGDEALAALAGRELVAPGRNQIISGRRTAHRGGQNGNLGTRHLLGRRLLHDSCVAAQARVVKSPLACNAGHSTTTEPDPRSARITSACSISK